MVRNKVTPNGDTNGARPYSGNAGNIQPINIQTIALDQIKPFKWSTGIRDAEIYEQLKENIKEHGIQNPPRLRKLDDTSYEPYIGDHRVMIAKDLGMKEIQCFVEDIDSDKALEICLSDNICRANLSCVELEDKVTELWNSQKYKSRAKLGEKIGLTGERVGQLISAKEIRDKSKGTLDTSISTQAILDTKALEDDNDKIALLMLVKNGIHHASEIKTLSKNLQAVDVESRNHVLRKHWNYNAVMAGKKLPESEDEPKDATPKEKVKTKIDNKNLVPDTYEFLKKLGPFIANIQDESQKSQALDYVKFSTALLLRILREYDIIHENTYNSLLKDKFDIDPNIIDSYDGFMNKGVEWYL